MALFWLPRAQKERHDAIAYIAQDNPVAALGQLDEIERQTDMPLEHPGIGRPGRAKNTRELVISKTPFIVVYRVRTKAERVELMRLLHSSQQWPSGRCDEILPEAVIR